jgi:putative endonuclease
LKNWNRIWKCRLISEQNPNWDDLWGQLNGGAEVSVALDNPAAPASAGATMMSRE